MGGTASCSSLGAWPLLSSSLREPRQGIPMRDMSGWVPPVRKFTERQEGEQAAVRARAGSGVCCFLRCPLLGPGK